MFINEIFANLADFDVKKCFEIGVVFCVPDLTIPSSKVNLLTVHRAARELRSCPPENHACMSPIASFLTPIEKALAGALV